MHGFTPGSALAGGALIGLAATLLFAFTGRTAGISGVVGGLVRPEPGAGHEWSWRAAFAAGLLLGGLVLVLLAPAAIAPSPRSAAVLAAAGLLVGFGSRMGDGCTSGHGVCGLARLSRRSAAATAVFMATGMLTVALWPWVAGAATP